MPARPAPPGLTSPPPASSTSLVVTVEAGMHGDFIEDSVRTMRSRSAGDLARVGEAVLLAEHADRLVVQVVREARQAGRSWGEIAAVLGTSAAHARQRVNDAR